MAFYARESINNLTEGRIAVYMVSLMFWVAVGRGMKGGNIILERLTFHFFLVWLWDYLLDCNLFFAIALFGANVIRYPGNASQHFQVSDLDENY
jgi:hypothetical protein